MLPMQAVREKLGTLLAADATTLAPPTNANKVALIVAPFVASETLTVAGLTLASGNGLDPILGATGAQAVAIDPTTLEQVITLIAAAAPGWRWVSSGTISSPITIYGAALVVNDLSSLLAVMSLDAPVVITAAGYQIDLDPLQMRFVLEPIS